MAATLSSRLVQRCRCGCLSVLSWRPYTQPGHNKTTEGYMNFKKNYTALRVKFMDEFKQEKKMMEEDFNSQAARDARMEAEREAKALAENEKELERMAREREKREAIWAMKMENKRLHGIEARRKVEEELKQRRTQTVSEIIEKSEDFVTMENLEEKIMEALDNEVNYNFALSTTGEILK